jgi:uncharacterized protein (TIGR03032 family)
VSERASQPGPQFRDIRCSHSEGFPTLLERLRLSVLISTYQTGHLVVVSARHGRLILSFHQFERAMGIAVKPGTIAVCTKREIWFLRDAPDIAAKIEPAGDYDACFLARTSHFTDDIEAHEVAWVGNEFWVVNTLFSCLAALHPRYSFAPRWRPPFVSELSPDDRCHLNGMAVVEDQVRYVTALGSTDSPAGWRAGKNNGGCLIEVPSGRLLAQGLSLPHAPRVVGQNIYLLHTGLGRLDALEPLTGAITTIAELPGVARGMAIHDGHAFVGLSKPRPTLEGVPIVENRERLKCGLWIIDMKTGRAAAWLEFTAGVEEIFDVQVLPQILCPYVSGPSASKEAGHPLWTVPPAQTPAGQPQG